MTTSAGLVEVLKRELRSRGITYAHVARELRLSEASVKRMFSRRNFSLKRLDQVCQIANSEFSDIARALHQEENLISRLTHEQEQEIVSNPRLFLVAVCALNHVGFDQIVETYDISRPECIQLLARLDRLGFIRLLPNNRIRLLVSLDFSWLPDGPIQRFFKLQAHNEYFRSRFDRPDEFMVVVNGMLSRASSAAIVTRLKRIAREFSELNNQDAHLPLDQRSAMSLLVAMRHWELAAFTELRRKKTVNSTGARL
jgi:transcriptional regulator with XRE-family HTH domain